MSYDFAPSQQSTNYLSRLALISAGAASLVWLLKTGTPIFQPFVFALVVGIIFAPLSEFFARIGAPALVGALAVLLIVLGVIALGFVIFYPVVAEFILLLPRMWLELQESLGGLKSTMENVESVQSKVAETLDANGALVVGKEGNVAVPSIADILAYLPSIAAQLLIFVGIVYFFLLTRSEIYHFIAKNTPRLTVQVLGQAEVQVSRYFLAVTAINACFGILAGVMLSAFGMPNAVYWGLGAFLVNFVLYLGPMTFALLLLIAGLIVFDGAMSFAPAVAYLAMNMTEGQFVTPSIVGRHMSVNPLLIFVSLVFWMWMWGPLGAVIAIPLLVWMRQIVKAIAPPAA